MSIIYKIPENEFKEIISRVSSGAGFFREAGLRYSGSSKQILDRRIKELGINTDHFCMNPSPASDKTRISLKDIFSGKKKYHNTHNLKLKIIKEGVLDNRCAECNLEDWRGKEISLHLDHINGIRDDNRLENLRLLCPNCHSQTETYCRGNKALRSFDENLLTN